MEPVRVCGLNPVPVPVIPVMDEFVAEDVELLRDRCPGRCEVEAPFFFLEKDEDEDEIGFPIFLEESAVVEEEEVKELDEEEEEEDEDDFFLLLEDCPDCWEA